MSVSVFPRLIPSVELLSHVLVSPFAHINSTALADSPKKHRLLNLHLSRSIAPAHSQHRCYLGHNIVLFCLYTFIRISLVHRVLHFLKDTF
ncbi:hypothetical protein QQF64_011655 [Cirrhinus molitorella]|uniref:Uncharacterized protein n=1 Tax=Cirrhinus molitorella TaxID=172907 RepID=A0ABR3LZW0_9TELE